METAYQRALIEDLPESCQKILDPSQLLNQNILFFIKVPVTIIRFILAICIGVPFLLGAISFSYHFVINFYHQSNSNFDSIIAILFILLSSGISWFFYDWCREGLKINKLIKKNQWRQGVYLFQEALLIQLGEYECYFLPRKMIQSIESVKVKRESGSGHLFRIDIVYRFNDENQLLEISEHDFELYKDNIDLARLGLHDFIKIYEVLEKWEKGQFKSLFSLVN